MIRISILGLCVGCVALATETTNESKEPLAQACLEQVRDLFPDIKDREIVEKPCPMAKVLDICKSVQGIPLMHFDFQSPNPKAKKVLVFATTHGDEPSAAYLGYQWVERLARIQGEIRNSWRIIPVLNPDGLKLNTRTNANSVDVNRNYPTKDWQELAIKYWHEKTNSHPRRNPGTAPATEPETLCSLKHIEEYQPDFVISIHAPYGVLDFDGPTVQNVGKNLETIPWKTLGTFPGSLGRYLWIDRKIPTLTVELKTEKERWNLEKAGRFQDALGRVVIK